MCIPKIFVVGRELFEKFSCRLSSLKVFCVKIFKWIILDLKKKNYGIMSVSHLCHC